MSNLFQSKKQIIMIGTAHVSKGGVSTVIEVLKRGGLFERCDVVFIASHRDGNAFAKIIAAIWGWSLFSLN